MNYLTRTTTAAAVLMATVGTAQAGDISANVAISSDYMFRGVSQTDNSIALSGGFDWAHESGFYLGTWMSNVDSQFFGDGTDPQLEMDFYAGYSGAYNDIGYDFSVVQFEYTGCDSCDTTEFYLSGSYSFLSATFAYTDEIGYLGSNDSAWYLNVGAEYEVMPNVNLHGAVGYSAGDAFDNFAEDSYMDYTIGVGTSMAGVDLDLSWVGVDSDGENLFNSPASDVADDRLVFSVSKSF